MDITARSIGTVASYLIVMGLLAYAGYAAAGWTGAVLVPVVVLGTVLVLFAPVVVAALLGGAAIRLAKLRGGDA